MVDSPRELEGDEETVDRIHSEYVAGEITLLEFEDRIEYVFSYGDDPADIHDGKVILQRVEEEVGRQFAKGHPPDALQVELTSEEMGQLEGYVNGFSYGFMDGREFQFMGVEVVEVPESRADTPRVVPK